MYSVQFSAPLSGALAQHFGVRPVVMTGGALAITGLFISSFASSIGLLFFTVPMTGKDTNRYMYEIRFIHVLSDGDIYNGTLL